MQRKRIYNDVIISFVRASSISLFQFHPCDLRNSRGKTRVKTLVPARKEERTLDSQPSMAQCARMLYVRCGHTCTRGTAEPWREDGDAGVEKPEKIRGGNKAENVERAGGIGSGGGGKGGEGFLLAARASRNWFRIISHRYRERASI